MAAKPGKSRTETYEDEVKEKFIRQPANMRLLIVVDKLLTGFDAPSCTYLYIDKKMQDHGLFQAICRTNRLDGDDKPFGYVVDYKELLPKVQGAIAVYTAELDAGDGGTSPEVMLEDRLKTGRERLEAAREALALLCEPVPPPREELQYIHYFCGNSEIASELAEHEPQRAALYKAVAALVRSYAALADSMLEAGYTAAQSQDIEKEVNRAVALRETIRQASGETLDLKAYEADMRHLIDTYIKAEDARKISDFGEIGLLDLIVRSGIAAAVENLPNGIRGDRGAVAETIVNNVRSRIIREHLHDPVFYERMSVLLAEVLADLRAQRTSYEEFLARLAAVAKQVQAGSADDTPEPLRQSAALRAVFNTLLGTQAAEPPATYGTKRWDKTLDAAQRIDRDLKHNAPDGWRGHVAKEQSVKRLLYDILLDESLDESLVEQLFPIITAQAEY